MGGSRSGPGAPPIGGPGKVGENENARHDHGDRAGAGLGLINAAGNRLSVAACGQSDGGDPGMAFNYLQQESEGTHHRGLFKNGVGSHGISAVDRVDRPDHGSNVGDVGDGSIRVVVEPVGMTLPAANQAPCRHAALGN